MASRFFVYYEFPYIRSVSFTGFLTLVFIAGLSLAITGCSSSAQKTNAANVSEQKLYKTAQNYLKRNQFILGIEALQKLESDFPFGKYANSAQLALIYAYYRSDELPLADSSARRYIRLHPNHPNVDYAYYIRGLSAFPKPSSLFQSALGTDLSKRDMKTTRTSFVYFSDLARRFPDSQYTPDALKRMEYLRNLLARHEITVANYYLDIEAYLAAVNRGRHVIENYQGSPSVPDALALMVQSYTAMSMSALAKDSLEVLSFNYPDYPALTKNGDFNFRFYRKNTKSLVGTFTFGLIDYTKPPGFDTRKEYGKY
jgi:outer membrane protein assembly factor BamD